MPAFRTANLFERWSLANAVGMLGTTVAAVWAEHSELFLVSGIALLALLVFVGRHQWTPQGDFGSANTVTAFRAGLLCFLPSAAAHSPLFLIGLSICVLATDGLDGWLARRAGRSSTFGAFFDKETDALFLLLLCGIAAFQDRLPAWILVAGLLRYGFVLLLFLPFTTETTEAQSDLARYIYSGMIGALLFSFLPSAPLARPLALLATLALTVSFGRSLWRMLPPSSPPDTP